MAPIPREILDIDRPKNTVVLAYGKNKDRYAVRERVGCTYKDGRRVPINGPIVGHIKDGVYVAKGQKVDTPQSISVSSIDLKDWGNVTLCNSLSTSILDDLLLFYNKDDALKIYCSAILRVCNRGIKDYELKDAYMESFLSEIYPNIALSRNTISTFWNNLGKAYSKICKFMEVRVLRVEQNHHIIIDGTLKSNESIINSLSNFSRKAKLKGSKDISVLYAYDLEEEEPICSKCFPGNMIDATSYKDFISENKITKGIIVADKGFPYSCAESYFNDNKDLHYINPLKRNSKYVKLFDLLTLDGQLENHENILYKKVKVKDDKFLFVFCDTQKAHKEDINWLHNAYKNSDFDILDYENNKKLFGIIILETDLDLDPKTAYKIYASRWEIELVMRYYKQTCEFDETREHDDYSVIGSEFCNFIASVMTYKMIKKFDKTKLLEKFTYKKIMKILQRAKKVRVDGVNWKTITMNPSQISVLQTLELAPIPEPKKRGRPPKNV